MKLGKICVLVIAAAALCIAAVCLRVAAGSPGNPSALELLRQAEAGKELSPVEREELAARAFLEMMQMGKERMESLDIVIEGKITDDKGNPLSDVSASVEYERLKEFIFTDAGNSESKRLDVTVGPEFSFREKGYLEVEIDFRKEGYAPRTLRYSTKAFLFGEKDDRDNLIQKDLHVVMKKLPPPAVLTGWSDSRSMIYSFADGKRSVCDFSKITRSDSIRLKSLPLKETPDAKRWLEFDLKRDEKGEIVPGEVTIGPAGSGIRAPAEFTLRLHSDDPGDGFIVTDRITEMKTYRDMEYDFRFECIEAPEGAYPAKEIVFPYKKESVNGRDNKVICAYVKIGGHCGKLLMRHPSVDTRRNQQREIEMERCRFELSLLLNIEPGDRNLSSYLYRKPVIPVTTPVPQKEEKVYERAPEGAIEVVVPDGVTQLDPDAFRTCPEVETVVLPNSLKYIPSKSFAEYKNLKSVVLPVHASIGSYAFRGCPALESVTISKTGGDVAPLSDTASVGQSAFENCTALRSIELPEVRFVGHFAFRGCTSLESIAIPNTVNFIGMEAFIMLPRLKTVTLPVHATVGNRAFRFCRALESVTLTHGGEIAEPWHGDPEEDDPYESGIGNEAFTCCSALKRFEFPTCVRIIGKDAFLSCGSLESITLPDELTTIDEGAFTQCSALKTLRIPDSVKTIGADVFGGCTALEKIELPAGPVEFGKNVFHDCLVLRDVKLSPFASKKVPERFFDNCRGLETVEFPSGITEIGDRVLDNCLELKSVTIPDGVESIGIRAFAGCPKLEHVSLPASLKTIGSWAFGGCGLKSVTIPEGVTEIDPEAFRGSPCEGAVRKVPESRRQKNR